MNCMRCGEELPENARFCPSCGAPVEDMPAPKKLEEPLEPMGLGAVPLVPVAPPPRASRITPRTPRTPAPRGSQPRSQRYGAPSYRPAAPAEQESEPASEPVAAPAGAAEPAPAPRADAPRDGEPATAPTADDTSALERPPASDQALRPSAPSAAARRLPDLSALRERVSSFRPDKRVAVLALCAVLAAIVVIVPLAHFSTSWFGPFADRTNDAPAVEPPSDGSIDPIQQDEPEEGEGAVEGGPEVRSALEDYSWEELSQISALVADAEDDAAAIDVAHRYNLCDEDGSVYVDSTKDLELTDGTTVPVAVAGLRHDERSDGSGAAGITFVARGSVGSEAMNANAQTAGGWEGSTLRAWLNGAFLDELPDGLADLLVSVDKRTNPVAGSGSTSQTVTSDSVWLLSYSEIVGELGPGSRRYGTYQSEGEQYQLFEDLGVTWAELAPQIALDGEYWWERSPEVTNASWFMCVAPDGTTTFGHLPATPDAVVIGFCL